MPYSNSCNVSRCAEVQCFMTSTKGYNYDFLVMNTVECFSNINVYNANRGCAICDLY